MVPPATSQVSISIFPNHWDPQENKRTPKAASSWRKNILSPCTLFLLHLIQLFSSVSTYRTFGGGCGHARPQVPPSEILVPPVWSGAQEPPGVLAATDHWIPRVSLKASEGQKGRNLSVPYGCRNPGLQEGLRQMLGTYPGAIPGPGPPLHLFFSLTRSPTLFRHQATVCLLAGPTLAPAPGRNPDWSK